MAAWRFQPLAYFLATGLLMWDFHAARRLLAWKERHAADLTPWLTAIGEMEALMSLATIGFVRDTYCFPELIAAKEPLLRMEDLSHPLLAPETAVPNSLQLTAGVCVLTGSNMSGKTTFLRAIGLALVLAYAGAPVCAGSFAASGMRLFSSLRVWDDVNLGISTFYAEILRVRAMVTYSARQAPMLALIDEIYKGTNTADRVIGAEATLKKMSEPWIICVVSTHDFELCELENDEGVKARNYHFAENYAGDELIFDYKLRSGRCQTTNARHILRMAGLI
jgi:DNA mismatch repair ATPase MutS